MRKIKNLIILITIQTSIRSLIINNENKEIILFPNHENIITPFEVEAESQLEYENDYYLKSICSSSIHKKLSFSTLSGNLCEKEHNFKFDSLNIFLNNLKARLDTTENINDLNINYEISYLDKDKKKIIFNFHQNFFLAKKIPVEEDINEFFYTVGKNTEFYVEILKIPRKYILNINQTFLKLVQTHKDFPDFINYVNIDGRFFLKGEIPKNFKDDSTLSYYIFDEFNQLLSEEKKFYLIKNEKSNSHFSILILFIIISLIVIILVIVLIYFYLKKKKLREKKKKINLDSKIINNNLNTLPSDRFGLVTDESSSNNIYNFKDKINLKNKDKFEKKNRFFKNESDKEKLDEMKDENFEINFDKDGKILENEEITDEEEISFENKNDNKI